MATKKLNFDRTKNTRWKKKTKSTKKLNGEKQKTKF